MSAPFKLPAPTMLDRALMAVAPGYATRRYQARIALNLTGQYAGAKANKTALKAWRTYSGSADADSLGDLPTLRARSRDLRRNAPIATGAANTSRTHTVGTGLRVRSTIDRELLGLTEEQAEAWERRTEKLFHLWASSTAADVTRTNNFYQLQGLVFDAAFESGDCLVLRRRPKVAAVAPLALAVIEADRLATPMSLINEAEIRSGVRLDEDGAPISYFVLDEHPGDYVLQSYLDFQEIPAFGERSGERMVLHVFRRTRPEQTRGIPEFAPVVEILKQLDRYSESELMAAVVSSFFTVFLKTTDDSGLPQDEMAAQIPTTPEEVVMGPGAVVNLGTNEDVVTANPGRANSNFDVFFSAVVRQIGVALGIPYELLIMHFASSYSASRAAIEMATKFFAERREWLVTSFCDPVYAWFMSDMIATGVIEAPGFFESPVRRAAWLGAFWVPPNGLILDPVKEWKADAAGLSIGVLTLEEVALKRTGGDWKQKTEQRGRERRARVDAGLEPAVLTPPRNGGASPAA